MWKVNSSLHPHKMPMSGGGSGQPKSHWAPNTDVYATEDGLVVKVELSGMRREDLELAVEGNRLIISGERPDGCRIPGVKFLVMEIHYGAFGCVIEVPDSYELSQARANYQNGFLRIDVPPRQTAAKSILVPISDGK